MSKCYFCHRESKISIPKYKTVQSSRFLFYTHDWIKVCGIHSLAYDNGDLEDYYDNVGQQILEKERIKEEKDKETYELYKQLKKNGTLFNKKEKRTWLDKLLDF